MAGGRYRSVLIEADGGSRGNPGPASYGAVLKDAETGEVIAEDATSIGIASNNVAEYSGLIGGLRLAEEFAPDAEIEVRMDSKLVVEQMSGRWKIKHPSMKPLAMEASRLAPFGTTYTWVPRERNKHADRLANEALDGKRQGVRVVAADVDGPESLIEEIESPSATPVSSVEEVAQSSSVEEVAQRPSRDHGPTTLVLLRHGVTEHTSAKRFSGGIGGANPGLSEEGRAQVAAAAGWLAATGDRIEAVVASPVRRTHESAEIVASTLGLPIEEEPGFAEMEFGSWDGLTFAEVAAQDQDGLDAWLRDLDAPTPGGESFRAVETRVLEGLDRVLTKHAGSTVVVVSHVTPIKTLVARALQAPLDAVYRMELTPASITVISYYPDPGQDADAAGTDGGSAAAAASAATAGSGTVRGSLRLYNALPPSRSVDGPL